MWLLHSAGQGVRKLLLDDTISKPIVILNIRFSAVNMALLYQPPRLRFQLMYGGGALHQVGLNIFHERNEKYTYFLLFLANQNLIGHARHE